LVRPPFSPRVFAPSPNRFSGARQLNVRFCTALPNLQCRSNPLFFLSPPSFPPKQRFVALKGRCLRQFNTKDGIFMGDKYGVRPTPTPPFVERDFLISSFWLRICFLHTLSLFFFLFRFLYHVFNAQSCFLSITGFLRLEDWHSLAGLITIGKPKTFF